MGSGRCGVICSCHLKDMVDGGNYDRTVILSPCAVREEIFRRSRDSVAEDLYLDVAQ